MPCAAQWTEIFTMVRVEASAALLRPSLRPNHLRLSTLSGQKAPPRSCTLIRCSSHLAFLAQCYCYVCDVKASECSDWGDGELSPLSPLCSVPQPAGESLLVLYSVAAVSPLLTAHTHLSARLRFGLIFPHDASTRHAHPARAPSCLSGSCADDHCNATAREQKWKALRAAKKAPAQGAAGGAGPSGAGAAAYGGYLYGRHGMSHLYGHGGGPPSPPPVAAPVLPVPPGNVKEIPKEPVVRVLTLRFSR